MDAQTATEITKMRAEIKALRGKMEILLARQFADELLLKAIAAHVADKGGIRVPLLKGLRDGARDFSRAEPTSELHQRAAARLRDLADEMEQRLRPT
ncbi:hypothetical protein Q5H91_04040 [Sphingomonas sp. KR1UV-12]|uniref:Uncharacterized protein n=1 Tax=Sphingomonas aurea TaxID=3063994 RepID=A0ABT9EHE2_9SPHN|nr:hypothetical protein [Sphingomonas sp. KR1UV-12]MDP1026372.1 hypothetical protein [Sphingomonas sp. KR1UV-12]